MPDRATVPVARGRIPMLGHILRLRVRPLAFLTALRAEGDIVRVDVGTMPVYVVNAPALIRRVLVTDRDEFEKGALFDKTRPVIGNGLVTSNGAFHARQRRLVQPAFRHERIARYREHMVELTQARVETWPPGRVVALDRELRELTLGIVSRTLFASRIGQDAAAEVQRSLPVVVHGFIRRTLSPAPVLERLPTLANRRFDMARAGLRAVVEDVIRAYRADPTDHDDLLSMLLRHHHDGGAGMSDQQLRDELITIMLAGTDTTAVALAWVFHELGRRPDVEGRVHREAMDATADGGDVRPMPYTTRVVNEALRCHTPPWIFMRRATTAVTLGGVRLPRGAELVISPATLHRDPAIYSHPERFDPDRWLPERARALPRGAFIPFGSGDRRCIGDSYAMTEMTTVIATVVSRRRLRPAPGTRVREVTGTLLRPSSLLMIADARPSLKDR